MRIRDLAATFAFVFVLGAAGARPAWARPELVTALDDEAGDAYGPGSYVAPGDSEISDADFDLRRFEVWRDGDVAIFKATMAAVFRAPGQTARTGSVPLQLWNSIYLQNIDIYVDTDPSSTAGYSVCVPGRRVAFSPGRTWKVAVVMTPQPGPAQGITEDALGEAGRHVIFPKDLQTTGRTVIARVPIALLGGAPSRSWAYAVVVSGARWERTFNAVDRVFRDKPAPDALTMPVLGVREAWAFGGAPEGHAHPRVIDVLLGRGQKPDQRAVLGSYNVQTGAYARVPFVQAPATEASPATAKAPIAPPPAAKPAARPSWKVVDISGATISIEGPVDGLRPMMIGRVVDAAGAVVARVVVSDVLPVGVVARAVEGADQLKPGTAVEFDPR